MCKIAFDRYGLVGVDMKSHQKGTSYPYPAVTQENDAQDTNCNTARMIYHAEDILILSGGAFAFMCKDGRMVTCAPNKFVRNLLRQRSFAERKTKTTQGQLSALKG